VWTGVISFVVPPAQAVTTAQSLTVADCRKVPGVAVGCTWQDVNYGGYTYVTMLYLHSKQWIGVPNLVTYGDNDIYSSLANNTYQNYYYYEDIYYGGAYMYLPKWSSISDLRYTSFGNWNDKISSTKYYNDPY